jgi:hypothetical protein
MVRKLVQVALLLLMMGIASAAPLPSSESGPNEWTMYLHDLRHTGYTDSTPPRNISDSIVTEFDTSGYIVTGPAVYGDSLYVGSQSPDGNLYQLNRSDITQVINSYNAGGQIQSVAIAGGYLFGTLRSGSLLKFNVTNISVPLQQYDFPSGIESGPTVYNGNVYVSTYDSLFQFDINDISSPLHTHSTGTCYSSPAADGGYLYVTCGSTLYQFDVNDVSVLVNSVSGGSNIYGSPSIAYGSVYVGDNSGIIYRYNQSNVTQLIDSHAIGGHFTRAPTIWNGSIYIGNYDSYLYQLNAFDLSEIKNSIQLSHEVECDFAIAGGSVFGGGSSDQLYQLNANNVSQVIGTSAASGYVTMPVVVDGNVYLGINHNLYRFYDPTVITTTTTTLPSAKGIKVEMEHTNDPEVAKEISKDHLTEFPMYYTGLAKLEKQLKAGKK